jgi:hypothetical protein
MRRLYPRGPDSRGVTVDANGAMLGPDCALVCRTPGGFRSLALAEARALQAAVLGPHHEPDWLFEQCRRIAAALSRGEIALAQIYGLYIPVAELDDTALRRLATAAQLIKANFDPDEPRIPKGEPGAGQWTYEEGYAKPREHGDGQSGEGSSGGGTGQEPPADAGGDEPGAGGDAGPPQIPAEPPATAKERNSFVRRAAVWLAQAAERQLRVYLLMLEMAVWPVEYLPEIRSYGDAPRSLEELQDAADNSPQRGYHDHHVVERQSGSSDPDSNARRFGDRLESRENIVRIPQWKHVEISAWYSTRNRAYGGRTPRDYLRGQSWDEQYRLGIQKLRDFGVLK